MFYKVVRAVLGVLIRIICGCKFSGQENIPKDGAAIFCSNHGSFSDPIAVAVGCPGRIIHFMGKKELFEIPVLKYIVPYLQAFPVDRSKNDMRAIKTALKYLKEGEAIGIFAQGTRVSEGDEAAAKGGVALIAAKSGAPIVPVHVIGRFGFRTNIKVVYGEPISLAEYRNQRLTTEMLSALAEDIMKKISAMEA